jgi:hypothetical protein
MGYFTTTEGTGLKSFTFWRSYEAPTPWENIGGIVVQEIIDQALYIERSKKKSTKTRVNRCHAQKSCSTSAKDAERF